ncbi:HIRAN domain-containing protein [Cohnella fermenti]|uniref:HIRAN domain-containing protein n=1 Tax=Cohnella fermenti TaxID=2565925 RepID=A0A4S4BJ14_9BACL|nr:HIRAN domain-containing protein [Cohnella fermenti]THF73628.1 hypothetical protein E6C55_28520 [Cohnella fermenti]
MEFIAFVAITGMNHYYGASLHKPGQPIHFRKEPDNPHDEEAIAAEIPPMGIIGYVANSIHTVPRGCRNAGRIYGELRLAGLQSEELDVSCFTSASKGRRISRG